MYTKYVKNKGKKGHKQFQCYSVDLGNTNGVARIFLGGGVGTHERGCMYI